MSDGYTTQFTPYDRKIDWARKPLDDDRLPHGLAAPAILLLSGAIWAAIMAMVCPL